MNDKIKTRCYYTDYVNHMIRFYLSTPTGLDLRERQYTSASIKNWTAVQMVFHKLPEKESTLVKEVFGKGHYLPKAVDDYCRDHGIDTDEGKKGVWMVLTRINAKIARVRGLM